MRDQNVNLIICNLQRNQCTRHVSVHVAASPMSRHVCYDRRVCPHSISFIYKICVYAPPRRHCCRKSCCHMSTCMMGQPTLCLVASNARRAKFIKYMSARVCTRPTDDRFFLHSPERSVLMTRLDNEDMEFCVCVCDQMGKCA